MVPQIPIPKSAVGRTFLVAISLLGVIAVAEIVALGRAWSTRPKSPPPAAVSDGKLELVDPFAIPATSEPTPPLARPTPIPQAAHAPAASPPVTIPPRRELSADAHIAELVDQARILRERGDTSTALIRLREAMTTSASDPRVISEMAITYEKMGLADKALDHWKRIYEMGESAGIYFAAAEAKIKNSEAPTPAPTPAPEATPELPAGVSQNPALSLLDITTTAQSDPERGIVVTLKIPVKARPNTKIEVSDVVVQVFFYDILGDQSLVQTNANVSSYWTTLPADWLESEIEILQVEYTQPLPDAKEKSAENRKYFGYVVRVYYKKELQDLRADPVKLLKQFPPPTTLTDTIK